MDNFTTVSKETRGNRNVVPLEKAINIQKLKKKKKKTHVFLLLL